KPVLMTGSGPSCFVQAEGCPYGAHSVDLTSGVDISPWFGAKELTHGSGTAYLSEDDVFDSGIGEGSQLAVGNGYGYSHITTSSLLPGAHVVGKWNDGSAFAFCYGSMYYQSDVDNSYEPNSKKLTNAAVDWLVAGGRCIFPEPHDFEYPYPPFKFPASGDYLGGAAAYPFPMTNPATYQTVGNYEVRDKNAGAKYNETVRVWTSFVKEYDDALGQYVAKDIHVAYDVEFSRWGDSYGIPFCTALNSSGKGDWGVCYGEDDRSDRHRVNVSFLGSTYVITAMNRDGAADITVNPGVNFTTAGHVRLSKELAYAYMLENESMMIGEYKMKLAAVTNPTPEEPYGAAILELYDSAGHMIYNSRLLPGEDAVWTAPNGFRARAHIYRVTAGWTPSSRWAEIGLYSNEVSLQDGEMVSLSGRWAARDAWMNKDYDTGGLSPKADTLRRLVLIRIPVAGEKLKIGESIQIVDFVKWQNLTFNGTDLVLSNWAPPSGGNDTNQTINETIEYPYSPFKLPYQGGYADGPSFYGHQITTPPTYEVLGNYEVTDNNANITYNETVRLWKSFVKEYDNSTGKYVAKEIHTAYDMEFSMNGDYYGIPFCTTKDPNANGNWRICETSWDRSDAHRPNITFLGSTWVISELSFVGTNIIDHNTEENFTTGGYVKLANETAYGILYVANETNNLTADNGYYVKLLDVTVPSSNQPYAAAVVGIYAPGGQLMQQTTIPDIPGNNLYTWVAPDGTKLMIKVYMATPGYTLLYKHAEMALYSREIMLRDGYSVEYSYPNPSWTAKIVWKNKEYNSSSTDIMADTLNRIVLVRNPVGGEQLAVGKALAITNFLKWKGLRFNGSDLVLTDWTPDDEPEPPGVTTTEYVYKNVRIVAKWPNGEPAKGAVAWLISANYTLGSSPDYAGYATEKGMLGMQVLTEMIVNGTMHKLFTPYNITVGVGEFKVQRYVDITSDGDIVFEMPKDYAISAEIKKGWNLVPFFNRPMNVTTSGCGNSIVSAKTLSPFEMKYVPLKTDTLQFANAGVAIYFATNYGTLQAPALDGRRYSPVAGGMWIYSNSTQVCKVNYSFDRSYLLGSGNPEYELKGVRGTTVLLDANDTHIYEFYWGNGTGEQGFTTPWGDVIKLNVTYADPYANNTVMNITFNYVPVGTFSLDVGERVGIGNDPDTGAPKYYVMVNYIGGWTTGLLKETDKNPTPWLANGWNFLTVLPWMKNKYWNDVKGECVAMNMSVWNVGKDGWDFISPSTVLFSPAYEGKVLAIRANNTCMLGSG
ncbi:MAG: hypothetical protein Q7T16_01135, partial [Candidatus Burarchaeum sp.]